MGILEKIKEIEFEASAGGDGRRCLSSQGQPCRCSAACQPPAAAPLPLLLSAVSFLFCCNADGEDSEEQGGCPCSRACQPPLVYMQHAWRLCCASRLPLCDAWAHLTWSRLLLTDCPSAVCSCFTFNYFCRQATEYHLGQVRVAGVPLAVSRRGCTAHCLAMCAAAGLRVKTCTPQHTSLQLRPRTPSPLAPIGRLVISAAQGQASKASHAAAGAGGQGAACVAPGLPACLPACCCCRRCIRSCNCHATCDLLLVGHAC